MYPLVGFLSEVAGVSARDRYIQVQVCLCQVSEEKGHLLLIFFLLYFYALIQLNISAYEAQPRSA